MGNCLRSNKVLAEDHDDAPIPKDEEAVNEQAQEAICSASASSSVSSKLESAKEGKKKKVVRFRLPEDEEEEEDNNKENNNNNNNNNNNSSNGGDSNSGVVRIKLVLTWKELKQVVNFMNAPEDDDHSSSVQQLLNVIKSRGQRVSEAGTSCATTARQDLDNGSLRPVLESISED